MADKPYSRAQYNRALITNALLDPFNVTLGTVVAIVGIVTGALPILGPVAALLYGAGAARTYFDSDVAREGARARARPPGRQAGRRRIARARSTSARLTPGIARIVRTAREREQRIREALVGHRGRARR